MCALYREYYSQSRYFGHKNTQKTIYKNGKVELGSTYERLKVVGAQNKSVGLFDNIEKTSELDPNDVIYTGFKELDNLITGWRKGEELVVVAGRTGQGKSWLGLKFALAAALQGYKAGIYSGEMSLPQLQERII